MRTFYNGYLEASRETRLPLSKLQLCQAHISNASFGRRHLKNPVGLEVSVVYSSGARAGLKLTDIREIQNFMDDLGVLSVDKMVGKPVACYKNGTCLQAISAQSD